MEELSYELARLTNVLSRQPEHTATEVFRRAEHVKGWLVSSIMLEISTRIGRDDHQKTYLLTVTATHYRQPNVNVFALVEVSERWQAQAWAIDYWKSIDQTLNLKEIGPFNDDDDFPF